MKAYRPTIMGTRHMVAACQYLAAEAGRRFTRWRLHVRKRQPRPRGSAPRRMKAIIPKANPNDERA
jgi:hypothetical protein